MWWERRSRILLSDKSVLLGEGVWPLRLCRARPSMGLPLVVLVVVVVVCFQRWQIAFSPFALNVIFLQLKYMGFYIFFYLFKN